MVDIIFQICEEVEKYDNKITTRHSNVKRTVKTKLREKNKLKEHSEGWAYARSIRDYYSKMLRKSTFLQRVAIISHSRGESSCEAHVSGARFCPFKDTIGICFLNF